MRANVTGRSAGSSQGNHMSLTALSEAAVGRAIGGDGKGYRGTTAKFDERFFRALTKELRAERATEEFRALIGKKLQAYLEENGLASLMDYIGADQQVYVSEWDADDASGVYVVIPSGKAFEIFDIAARS